MHLDRYREGLALFDQGRFFEAHEVLEDVWREAPADERKFFQGLIQAAVALHHHSRGNRAGCRSLLARACRNLSLYPAKHGGLELGALLVTLAEWRAALEEDRTPPPPPTLSIPE